MESTIVIKVKFGETLRRFNASIIGEKLDLDMNKLREKITYLFSFTSDTELTLTYIDEDGDVVTLADENDLDDVVRQSLNPLRISVALNTERSVKSHGRSSGSSTPMRSPRVQPSSQHLDGSVTEILKSVPEAILEKLSRLSTERGSNTTGSPPIYGEILDSLSKIGLHYLQEVAGTKSRPLVNTTDTQVNRDDSNVEVDGTKQATILKSKEANQGNGKGASDSLTMPAYTVDLGAATHGDKLSVGSSSINPPPSSFVAGFPGKDNGSTFAHKLKEKEKSNESYMGWNTAASFLAEQGVSGTKDAAVDSGNSFGSQVGVNSFGDCPFLGLPVDNPSSFMPGRPYAPRVVPFKKSYNHNDGIGSIFHRGVRCDGCGVHPITGPRFKSVVKEDYDLCSICVREIGNDTDYFRMDRPFSYRHPLSLKGLWKPPVRGPSRPKFPPQVSRGSASKSKLDCLFIQDVNIDDGTVMTPSTPFTKIWRMKNNGNVVWPSGSQLVWIGGDMLSKILSAELEIPADGCPVGTEIDIAVDFVAPEHPGRYISYWRMTSPSGQKFGQRVWVLIQVEAANDFSSKNIHDFNLNMLPFSGGIVDSQKDNVESLPKTDNLERAAELVEPVTDAPSNPDQELNFPINDTLLVGGTASNPVPLPAPSPVASATSSEVAAPIATPPVRTFHTDVIATPNVPTFHTDVIATPPVRTFHTDVIATPPVRTFHTDVDTKEQILLKELEEMGFKQVDFNKEILRMNAYNLEQSVNHICGVSEAMTEEMSRMDEHNSNKEILTMNEDNAEHSADGISEWDTILVELQEMGFYDKEKNKILLEKNNGSIKYTVMDLINGEK